MSFALREGSSALRQSFFRLRLMLGGEALLHPAIDLGLAFRGGVLARAGTESERERCSQKRREQMFSPHNLDRGSQILRPAATADNLAVTSRSR